GAVAHWPTRTAVVIIITARGLAVIVRIIRIVRIAARIETHLETGADSANSGWHSCPKERTLPIVNTSSQSLAGRDERFIPLSENLLCRTLTRRPKLPPPRSASDCG